MSIINIMMVHQILGVLCLIAFTIPATLSCNGGHSHDAPNGKYDQHVSIRINGEHACSGSIINKRHILSSSSCTFATQVEDVTVVAGTNSLKSGGDSYKIEEIITPDSMFDNIALLRTKSDITFRRGVQKIDLANYNDYDNDQRVRVVGWELPASGETRKNDMLQEFSLKLYDKDICKQKNKWNHDKFMCIFDPAAQNLCNTDEGGAIIAGGLQIGIFLNRDSCYEASKPQPHTPVYEYLDWIKQNSKVKRSNDGESDRHAHNGAYPYHVSIRSNKEHICSGSIINKRHVLTSYICILRHKVKDLTVVPGINSLGDKAKFYRVQKIVPTYNDDYDIAILRITKNFIFNDLVNSIPVITSSYELDDSNEMTLTGWNREIFGNYKANLLQTISYQIYDLEKCRQGTPFFNEAYICATALSSKNICDIDYGGPIVANGVQVGLNPSGVRCESSDEPHVFIPLFKHSSWINRNSRP